MKTDRTCQRQRDQLLEVLEGLIQVCWMGHHEKDDRYAEISVQELRQAGAVCLRIRRAIANKSLTPRIAAAKGKAS